jgi:hypothetical protein
MPRVIPGLVLDLPKATPAEKRKRKRLAAKAAKATKSIPVGKVSTNTEDAKVVLTIKGPPINTGTSQLCYIKKLPTNMITNKGNSNKFGSHRDNDKLKQT